MENYKSGKQLIAEKNQAIELAKHQSVIHLKRSIETNNKSVQAARLVFVLTVINIVVTVVHFLK